MTGGGGWPEIRPGRLGEGVILEARVLRALRVSDDPCHERVLRRLFSFTESGLPLAVSYPSLMEAARQIHEEFGLDQTMIFIREAREILNVILPDEEDVAAAEEFLANGVEHITLEQAVAGIIARRLGCSIYGFSPAYHLMRVAVVMD